MIASCYRVLVADDEPEHLQFMRQTLSAASYDVVTATDCATASDLFTRLRPDLVLLKAGGTGIELCKQIKGDPQTSLTPVILVNTRADSDDRTYEAKADAWIGARFRRDELLAKIQSLLSWKPTAEDIERDHTVLFALARSIESRDPYAHGHCERLAGYSTQLGQALGLTRDQLATLWRAAMVHDIGKVAVPDAILLRPGPLTPDEFRVVQQHPNVGVAICSPLKTFRLALPIIRHHHEKLDGTGYPDQLEGENIPLAARILQITDIYDALTTRRPYHDPVAREGAFAILREEAKRGWRDANLIDEFERVLKSSPASTAAEFTVPRLHELGPSVREADGVLPLSELERQSVMRAMSAAHGNKLLAARSLGVSRSTLYRKLQEYGLFRSWRNPSDQFAT